MNHLSTKNSQKLFFLLLFIAIILIKVYFLLIYAALFFISFLYLNSNEKYQKLEYYKFYNWIFIVFLSFIVLVRSNLFNFAKQIKYNLNTIEHLFFAFILCLLLSIYMQLFNLIFKKYLVKMLVIFILFNFIGLLNEYFQNFYSQTQLFNLKENDIKDIFINFIGSTLFLITSIFYKIKN